LPRTSFALRQGRSLDQIHADAEADEVSERELKPGQSLSSLIERGGSSRDRQEILTALGISPTALSQYTRDQVRPSFQKLLALADFFGVSLDYLVYGEITDGHAATQYVNESVSRAMVTARRHTDLVGHIGRVLADRVEEAARELADFPTVGRRGQVQDDEAARIEGYCLSARDPLNLEYNLIALPDSQPAVGRFLEVVAMNLLKGCDYQFLVPLDSEAMVEQCRSLPAERVGRDAVKKNCSFRRTEQRLQRRHGHEQTTP
jgi:transcriptional regulator with XRE-family HTH domain